MARTLYSAPAVEPVSTDEAKTHLRITHTDDNTYIDTLVKAARLYCERATRRAFITQTWDLAAECFDDDEIELTPGPLQSITHVKYYDTDGTLQTLSTDVYEADITDCVGYARLKYNQYWPTIRSGLYNGVQVRYVAGYGNSATDVPANIKHAIKILVSHWYEIREPVIVGASVTDVPMSVSALLGIDSVLEVF